MKSVCHKVHVNAMILNTGNFKINKECLQYTEVCDALDSCENDLRMRVCKYEVPKVPTILFELLLLIQNRQSITWRWLLQFLHPNFVVNFMLVLLWKQFITNIDIKSSRSHNLMRFGAGMQLQDRKNRQKERIFNRFQSFFLGVTIQRDFSYPVVKRKLSCSQIFGIQWRFTDKDENKFAKSKCESILCIDNKVAFMIDWQVYKVSNSKFPSKKSQ